EDGIRDDLVTGVQTCALPISPARSINSCTLTPPTSPSDPPTTVGSVANTATPRPSTSPNPVTTPSVGGPAASLPPRTFLANNPRSEERRVGKDENTHRSRPSD